ncbi:MAG: hypothetical protein M3305_13470, partial [Actinomycetota bacterium]|nr:hypothetical protein [Actinomycetota bacterium]
FEHRSHSAAVGSPAGMVVDLGLTPRRPDEDLQGVGAVLSVEAIGHVPLFDPPRLLQQRKDVRIQEGGILYQMSQEGGGSSQGGLCGKAGELLKVVGIGRG